MPVFVQDPSQLSKSRLVQDLINHNVALPPPESKKEVYVELYLKHIDQRNAADFSSDEEEQTQNVDEAEEEDSEMVDPSELTDEELKAKLITFGVQPGPIVGSTRALYERKLKKLLQADVQPLVNGEGDAAQYSDSEEEEGEESAAEPAEEEKAPQVDQNQEDSTREESHQAMFHSSSPMKSFHQCFLLSSRLRPKCVPGRWKAIPARHAGNAVEPFPGGSQQAPSPLIPTGVNRIFTIDQRPTLRSAANLPSSPQTATARVSSSSSFENFSITDMVEEMDSRRSLTSSAEREREQRGSYEQEHCPSFQRKVQMVDRYTMTNRSLNNSPVAVLYKQQIEEAVKDVLEEMFKDTAQTPTGISATRRRPIKGAAGRPVQYKYPDTPVSPVMAPPDQTQEAQRRLIPLWVQVLVFLIVACLLFLIYAYVLDLSASSFVALLDNLSQDLESEEGLSPQADTRDPPVLD